MVMSNFIDEAERHGELYGYENMRQRMLLALIERNKNKLSDVNQIKIFLHDVNVNSAEINWLLRMGYIYLD